MVTCKFNGRLGNNLFQVATVIALSKELGVNFTLPHTTWAGHRGNREVDLSMFEYEFSRQDIEMPNSYSEIDFNYNKIDCIDNLCISGFYQSWKYFDNVKKELISKYFTPSKSVIDGLKKYDISNNALGISVRRGDYLMLQGNHCVLSVDYYQNVINEYFQNNIDSIYVFSDDLEWCYDVFGDSVYYVNDNVGTQLFLMSKMKHLILSNSTFAWWGAYLNQNDGLIIAPDPWFGPDYSDKNTSDLYCKNWIRYKHTIINHNFTLTNNMFN